MSELIDREKLKSAIRNKFTGLSDRCEINEIINAQPTVDSVVHCKDCIYYETHLMNSCMNTFWNHDEMIPIKPDDYCSKGVRKMDEDTEREDNK